MSLVDCTKREHNDQNVEIQRINELTEAANGHHHQHQEHENHYQSYIDNDTNSSSSAPLKSNGHFPPSTCNGYGMELASLDRIQRKCGKNVLNILLLCIVTMYKTVFYINSRFPMIKKLKNLT